MSQPTPTTPSPTGPHPHPQATPLRRPRPQINTARLWLDGPTATEVAAGRRRGTATGLPVTSTRASLLNHRRMGMIYVEQIDALLADLDDRAAADFTDLPVTHDVLDLGQPATDPTAAAPGGAS